MRVLHGKTNSREAWKSALNCKRRTLKLVLTFSVALPFLFWKINRKFIIRVSSLDEQEVFDSGAASTTTNTTADAAVSAMYRSTRFGIRISQAAASNSNHSSEFVNLRKSWDWSKKFHEEMHKGTPLIAFLIVLEQAHFLSNSSFIELYNFEFEHIAISRFFHLLILSSSLETSFPSFGPNISNISSFIDIPRQ